MTRAVIIVLAAAALLGSVALVYPHGRDQSVHALLADRVLKGQVMYRDLVMYPLPLTVVVHVLSLLLFGHSMTAIRGLDLLWVMATAAFVTLFVGWGFRRQGWALLAGVLYALYYYLVGFWHTAQNDGFMNLPVAAGLACAARALQTPDGPAGARRVKLSWLLAGVLFGLALFFKYTIILLIPLVALVAVLTAPVRRQGWMWCALVLAGSAGGALLIMLGLAVTGALPEFLLSQARLTLPYAGVGVARDIIGRGTGLVRNYIRLQEVGLSTIPAVLGLLSVLVLLRPGLNRAGREGSAAALLLAWLLAAGFSTFVQGKFFAYQYLPLFAPVAVLSALAVVEALRPWAARLTGLSIRSIVLAAGLLLVVLNTSLGARYLDLLRVVSGQVKLRTHWESAQFTTASYSVAEQLAIADLLNRETEPEDRIFVFGIDPLIYFQTERKGVSRFLWDFPATASYAWPGYRAELLKTLRDSLPEVFIVAHNDRRPWAVGHNRDAFESLKEWPELLQLVTENYEYTNSFAHHDVLRQRNPEQVIPEGINPRVLEQDLREAWGWLEWAGPKIAEYRSVLCPLLSRPRCPGCRPAGS